MSPLQELVPVTEHLSALQVFRTLLGNWTTEWPFLTATCEANQIYNSTDLLYCVDCPVGFAPEEQQLQCEELPTDAPTEAPTEQPRLCRKPDQRRVKRTKY